MGSFCLNQYIRGEGVGGTKVANNVIRKRKCHFGATYMDGMTGDPPLCVRFSKGY